MVVQELIIAIFDSTTNTFLFSLLLPMKRTPAQQQYHELKQQNPESLLLFRMGDFYETFHEDAHIAHKVLWITLTARDKKSAHPIPMAGIPHHALDKYLPKIINAWYKVAIAEQVWEVIPWTVVRREVTQHITPWTRSWSDDPVREIVGVWSDGEKYWTINGDSTLGSFMIWSSKTLEWLFQWLMSIEPCELVVDIQLPNKHEVERWANQVKWLVVSVSDVPRFPNEYVQSLTNTDTLEGYGDALAGWWIHVAWLLFQYLLLVQWSCNIQRIWMRSYNKTVRLDPLTIRNLELFQSQYEWKKEHSLLSVIDHCETILWSRYLSSLVRSPSRDLKYLHGSHDRITFWIKNSKRIQTHLVLSKLTDIAKIPSRIQRWSDVQKLLIDIKNNAEQVLLDPTIVSISSVSHDLLQWLQNLVECIDSEWERFFIYGFNQELDTLYDITQDIDNVLIEYHKEVVAHTWINWVRVKYSWTQWYCIETSKKDAKKLMESATTHDHFAFYPRQSLKSAERFSTPYLLALENTIHQAQEDYQSCFIKCINELANQFLTFQSDWFDWCEQIACHDVALASAALIETHKRSLPTFSSQWELRVVGWRHPVVEKFLTHTQQFVPNDLNMSEKDSFHLITWPNMGWKSTYLRQNALIVLLAHVGLPVPANHAVVPIVDGIYARVWSGDALAKNQSTFMTEMIEMANIINNATKDSFIVLDELWRWTSTYDGMALAHALSVNICHLWSKTLFATHYHELIALEKTYSNFSNRQVSVVETDSDIVFMRKIISWWADKSYGLHVARRAWIPDSIVDQAEDKLNELIKDRTPWIHQAQLLHQKDIQNFSETHKKQKECFEQLLQLNIDKMTPIDALVHLHQLKIQFLQTTSTDT